MRIGTAIAAANAREAAAKIDRQAQLQAAATAIAALHHDNIQLRQDLEQDGRIKT